MIIVILGPCWSTIVGMIVATRLLRSERPTPSTIRANRPGEMFTGIFLVR